MEQHPCLPDRVAVCACVLLLLGGQAVRKCVERLWLIHQDFLKHMAGEPSPQEVLFRYQHMFKGIKVSTHRDRFARLLPCVTACVDHPHGSCVWVRKP